MSGWERDDVLKRNALKLAALHREACDDENCSVSLALIGALIERAGISLTEDERAELL